ncbi:MAG: flagellar basal body-associated protein FliL [Jhaorihella sp.]
MTDAAADTTEPPARSRKAVFALWLILALAGAGGGFFAVRAGVIPLGAPRGPGGAHDAAAPAPDAGVVAVAAPQDTAFVAIAPIMVSLETGRNREHLRFRAQLEVPAQHAAEVAGLEPRIVDVLNGYLRALELADLRDPLALTRLRGQMLRRIKIVAGPGRVRDLLIMEFVLN